MASVRAVEATIRTYERRDAAGVADILYPSVREVALSDYTAEQVKAWVAGRWDAEQEHRRSGDGRLVLVAADESGHVRASRCWSARTRSSAACPFTITGWLRLLAKTGSEAASGRSPSAGLPRTLRTAS